MKFTWMKQWYKLYFCRWISTSIYTRKSKAIQIDFWTDIFVSPCFWHFWQVFDVKIVKNSFLTYITCESLKTYQIVNPVFWQTNRFDSLLWLLQFVPHLLQTSFRFLYIHTHLSIHIGGGAGEGGGGGWDKSERERDRKRMAEWNNYEQFCIVWSLQVPSTNNCLDTISVLHFQYHTL